MILLSLFFLTENNVADCFNTCIFRQQPSIRVKKTMDFQISGDGAAKAWKKAKWIRLSQIKGKYAYKYGTKVKVLYSDVGLYFLFSSEDKILTASIKADFKQLWKEDVVEIFLEPDKNIPDYLEFELSPLNFMLPLLVLNSRSKNTIRITLQGNEGSNQIRHKTSVEGGERTSGASIKKWKAEIFIPYKLMKNLNNLPPAPGIKWKINLYRIDYDFGETKWWAWQPINKSFHEPENFGTLIFE